MINQQHQQNTFKTKIIRENSTDNSNFKRMKFCFWKIYVKFGGINRNQFRSIYGSEVEFTVQIN